MDVIKSDWDVALKVFRVIGLGSFGRE